MKTLSSRHDPLRYGRGARILHWLMATLVIPAIVLGFTAALIGTNTTNPTLKTLRDEVLFWHKSIGVTVLLLGLVRIGWSLTHRRPPLPAHLPKSERILARTVHAGLYFLLIAMPVTGILLSQAVGFPVVWFGFVTIPDFVHPDLSVPLMQRTSVLITFIFHEKIFAYSLLAILTLHIVGLVKHHWLDRDSSIWRRMSPWDNAASVDRVAPTAHSSESVSS